jgi:hypothetical protein
MLIQLVGWRIGAIVTPPKQPLTEAADISPVCDRRNKKVFLLYFPFTFCSGLPGRVQRTLPT